jgi:hypothetical protein
MSEENKYDYVDKTIYGYDIIEINAVLEKRKPICIENNYKFTEEELKIHLEEELKIHLEKESEKLIKTEPKENYTQIIQNIMTAIKNKQLLYIDTSHIEEDEVQLTRVYYRPETKPSADFISQFMYALGDKIYWDIRNGKYVCSIRSLQYTCDDKHGKILCKKEVSGEIPTDVSDTNNFISITYLIGKLLGYSDENIENYIKSNNARRNPIRKRTEKEIEKIIEQQKAFAYEVYDLLYPIEALIRNTKLLLEQIIKCDKEYNNAITNK